jgi:hypothetical protein
MEASLLPSKAITKLSKEVVLVVVKQDDPACAALRTEFAVPYLNSWVVVLDAKGETLASWIGDAAGGGCDKDKLALFPGKLVELIRRSLDQAESVEELERRWKADLSNADSFERLAERLAEMHRRHRLSQVCIDAAADPSLPEQKRNEYRLRAFIARASDHSERRFTPASKAKFVREGERLLIELAGHPKSTDLVDILFATDYAHGFDVPARSDRAIARLRRAKRRASDPGALEERIRQLSEAREKWIEEMTAFLQKSDSATTKNFLAATLGDAEAAIQLFSQPPYNEVPQYREWLREANEKAERERMSGPTVNARGGNEVAGQ